MSWEIWVVTQLKILTVNGFHMKTEFIAKEIFYSLSSINLSLSLSLSAITKHSIFTTHLSLSPTCHSSLSLFITRPLQSIKILQSPWTPLSPIQTHKFLRSTHFNQIPPNHLRVHLIGGYQIPPSQWPTGSGGPSKLQSFCFCFPQLNE